MLSPRASLLVLCLPLLAASGCARLMDADQERICRTLIPALNAAGATFQIVRVTPVAEERTIRIVYRVQEPDMAARTRFVACRFSDALSGQQDIVSVRTDTGPLSETGLHFLRRFYLANPESAL